MPPYAARFPQGARVRVVDADALRTFMRDWKYHNRLTPDQLDFAGAASTVQSVGFYHGGDVLYELEEIPGSWHECCLEEIEGFSKQ